MVDLAEVLNKSDYTIRFQNSQTNAGAAVKPHCFEKINITIPWYRIINRAKPTGMHGLNFWIAEDSYYEYVLNDDDWKVYIRGNGGCQYCKGSPKDIDGATNKFSLVIDTRPPRNGKHILIEAHLYKGTFKENGINIDTR